MKNLTIIGAGLVGSLSALYMAKRGYKVCLYEARKDPRATKMDAGRSINLAMSCRGLTSLTCVGLLDKATKFMVPMRARAIHEEQNNLIFQPFGRQDDEYIRAILRADLNNLLLDEAEADPLIQIKFEADLQQIDFEEKHLYFKEKTGSYRKEKYDRLIGADGVGSFVRTSLLEKKIVEATRTYLPHGYKELTIYGKNKDYFAKEHLHLWPRNAYLLLGNPNLDGSITGSLFMPKEGPVSFAALDNELNIHQFFKQQFPDAYDSMPYLADEMLHHPMGTMSTVTCSPWYYKDCLLIGDAAHGIVPFFGQGMNCGFEDCRILNQLLEDYLDDWQRVLPAFYQARKANSLAVAAMSMANYHEIHEDIRDPQFHLKKRLELELMHRYPTVYQSKHVLVMFTNMSYAKAEAIGDVQAEFLTGVLKNKHNIEEIDWNQVDMMVHDYACKVEKLF